MMPCFDTYMRYVYFVPIKMLFRYLDLVLIHYPKADASKNNDPRNPENRKDAYLELEKLKGNHFNIVS